MRDFRENLGLIAVFFHGMDPIGNSQIFFGMTSIFSIKLPNHTD